LVAVVVLIVGVNPTKHRKPRTANAIFVEEYLKNMAHKYKGVKLIIMAERTWNSMNAA